MGRFFMITTKFDIDSLIGTRYGKRVVVGRADKKIAGSYAVVVQCDCGNIASVAITRLLSGRQQICIHCLNRQQTGNKNRSWRGGRHISKTAFNAWRISAEKRNITWELSVEYLDSVLEAQNFKCALTGEELGINHGYKNRQGGNASLDRIDSGLGYIEGNVQFVTKHINYAKQAMPDSDFIELCRKVVNYADRNL
jgi:hypothetical protein